MPRESEYQKRLACSSFCGGFDEMSLIFSSSVTLTEEADKSGNEQAEIVGIPAGHG